MDRNGLYSMAWEDESRRQTEHKLKIFYIYHVQVKSLAASTTEYAANPEVLGLLSSSTETSLVWQNDVFFRSSILYNVDKMKCQIWKERLSKIHWSAIVFASMKTSENINSGRDLNYFELHKSHLWKGLRPSSLCGHLWAWNTCCSQSPEIPHFLTQGQKFHEVSVHDQCKTSRRVHFPLTQSFSAHCATILRGLPLQ